MTYPSHPDIDEEKLEGILDICGKQHAKIKELNEVVADQSRKLARAESELDELRAKLQAENSIRPSLEVLQRMANGIDPFDRGRFQCAVAALPHETPKLSATMSQLNIGMSIADRLDRANGRSVEQRARERGLVTIEGG